MMARQDHREGRCREDHGHTHRWEMDDKDDVFDHHHHCNSEREGTEGKSQHVRL